MTVPNDVLTDTEVVDRVRHGDRDAFRVLVHRYQDSLYRTAVSMVQDRDVAADVVQATFVKAFSDIRKLDEGSNFGGWAYRSCVNRCRDFLKSQRRHDLALEDAPPASLQSRDRPDTALDRAELRRSLDSALSTLSDEYREAFVLKHVEEKSYEAMAQVLNASVPALKMRVHRAREALKTALEEVL
ncbi:MAG: sigma-70 family RNA polymerase sigma factor [Longimicrobiales bacterium]